MTSFASDGTDGEVGRVRCSLLLVVVLRNDSDATRERFRVVLSAVSSSRCSPAVKSMKPAAASLSRSLGTALATQPACFRGCRQHSVLERREPLIRAHLPSTAPIPALR